MRWATGAGSGRMKIEDKGLGRVTNCRVESLAVSLDARHVPAYLQRLRSKFVRFFRDLRDSISG